MRIQLLILLLLLADNSKAQVMIGARAGWTFATQHLDRPQDPLFLQNPAQISYDNIPLRSAGPTASVTVDLPITDVFLLGLEIAYSQRGYHRTDIFTESFRTKHIGGSILPKARLGEGLVKLELMGGLDLAVPISSEFEYTGVYTHIMPADEFDRTYTRSDLLSSGLETSLVAGGGLAMGTGPLLIHLTARYIHGLANIYNSPIMITNEIGWEYGRGEMKNRSMTISLGFSVSL